MTKNTRPNSTNCICHTNIELFSLDITLGTISCLTVINHHIVQSWIHLSTGYEQGAQDEAKNGIKFTIGKTAEN